MPGIPNARQAMAFQREKRGYPSSVNGPYFGACFPPPPPSNTPQRFSPWTTANTQCIRRSVGCLLLFFLLAFHSSSGELEKHSCSYWHLKSIFMFRFFGNRIYFSHKTDTSFCCGLFFVVVCFCCFVFFLFRTHTNILIGLFFVFYWPDIVRFFYVRIIIYGAYVFIRMGMEEWAERRDGWMKALVEYFIEFKKEFLELVPLNIVWFVSFWILGQFLSIRVRAGYHSATLYLTKTLFSHFSI